MKKPKYFYVLVKHKNGILPDTIHRYQEREYFDQWLNKHSDRGATKEEITVRKAIALIKAYRQATGGHGGYWMHFQSGITTHIV